MIIDRYDNLADYVDKIRNLGRALEYIKNRKGEWQPGRYDFDGGYIIYQDAETKDICEGTFESHKRYTDIQIILEGKGWLTLWNTVDNLNLCMPYDEKSDTARWEGDGAGIELQEGMFVCFFPRDAHKPDRHRHEAASGRVKKIVIKLETESGYPDLSTLSPNGILYRNKHLNTVEAELKTGGFRTAHAPCLLETESKDILCIWFAGSYEGGTDINIVGSILSKDSDKWSEPFIISNDENRSDQNPSLFKAPDGSVWAMYTSQRGRTEGEDNMQYTAQIRCQKSPDGGRTWYDFETVFAEEGTFTRQPIQILSDGRWIFGNWICRRSEYGLAGDTSAFKISDDEGKTWKHVDMPDSAGKVHPTVVELEKNHLAAFMRSRLADNIYRSDSYDNGDTWSAPQKTVLPNNNSGISAVKLSSGRLAIAYNPMSAPDTIKNGSAWPGLRCPVAVALSEDGGKTFPAVRNLELGEGFVGDNNKANNFQYEYPYLMQAENGEIHLVYAYKNRESIKWIKFTEEDILGKITGDVIYNPTSGKV